MGVRLLPAILLLASSAAAWAQDGGKVAWRGKNEDPKQVLADARSQGRLSFLFFSSVGCKYCREISQGAFSDPAVVDASAGLVCVFVECDWGKKNQELAKEFNVAHYPTLFLCDAEGKDTKQFYTQDAALVLREIRTFVRKHSPGSPSGAAPEKASFPEYSPALLAAARKASKLMLVFFTDESQASDAVARSLADPLVRDLRNRFSVAQTTYRKDSEISRQWEVTRAPTLLALDPRKEKPEAQVIGRVSGSRSPHELVRDFEELLGGSSPASRPGDASPPSPAAAPPQENLSDDEVDRKFIQARLTLALDASKRGQKEKAVDILEDVIQSFPRHVLTKEARTLLDQLKK